jgi:hypothetical protein
VLLFEDLNFFLLGDNVTQRLLVHLQQGSAEAVEPLGRVQ